MNGWMNLSMHDWIKKPGICNYIKKAGVKSTRYEYSLFGNVLTVNSGYL